MATLKEKLEKQCLELRSEMHSPLPNSRKNIQDPRGNDAIREMDTEVPFDSGLGQ